MTMADESVAFHERIVYACHDGTELVGDLYRPDGAGPHPVILAVPGGAWRNARRGSLAHWGRFLAGHGYAVFSIDYRQALRTSSFPQAVQDVWAAAQFLSGQNERLSLDAQRLHLLGASAGAHLAALTALAGARQPFSGAYPQDPHADQQPNFRSLIAAYGVYDLFAHWQETRELNPVPQQDVTERFLGCGPFEDPGRYFLASPLRHITSQLNTLKVFLTWGTHDTAVSPRQSEAFRLALEQAGFYVRAQPVLGAGHYWFSEDALDDPHGFTAAVGSQIIRFLARISSAQTLAE